MDAGWSGWPRTNEESWQRTREFVAYLGGHLEKLWRETKPGVALPPGLAGADVPDPSPAG